MGRMCLLVMNPAIFKLDQIELVFGYILGVVLAIACDAEWHDHSFSAALIMPTNVYPHRLIYQKFVIRPICFYYTLDHVIN